MNQALRDAMSQPAVEPRPEIGLRLPAVLQFFGGNPIGDTAVSVGISGKLDADMTPTEVTAAVGGTIPGLGGIGLNKTIADPPLEPSSKVEISKEDTAAAVPATPPPVKK